MLPRFVRYAAVGAVATAAHYGVLVSLVEAAQRPAWVASGIGAAIGAQLAFFGNRVYTFGHRGPVVPAWLRFHGTALAGALLGMLIVGLGVRAGLHYLVAQVVATAAGLLLTFAINRGWTFR
jgi:putative flippase GtrA